MRATLALHIAMLLAACALAATGPSKAPPRKTALVVAASPPPCLAGC